MHFKITLKGNEFWKCKTFDLKLTSKKLQARKQDYKLYFILYDSGYAYQFVGSIPNMETDCWILNDFYVGANIHCKNSSGNQTSFKYILKLL